MATRLLDTLLFQDAGVYGPVYYDDGLGTSAGRSVYVEWRKTSDNSPTQRPGGAPTRRAYQPGQVMLGPFCEDQTAVTLTAQAFEPYAVITAEVGASQCAAPTVVCDLTVTGSVSGLTVTLTVTTSHGPWASSIDGGGFAENRASFARQYGERGTITVRDAANCRCTYDYVIPEPGNPKPEGVLTDYFNYGNGSSDETRVEVYVLQNEPFTVAAWSPRNVALPGLLTEGQRGRVAGAALPPRCGGAAGTTQVRYYALLQPPFLRVETTENSPGCGYVPLGPPAGDFHFDYVLGTDETVAGGDGLIQAAVLGNDGPVLFSLDNYRTPGQANADGRSTSFPGLRAGVYTVWARETRPQGRTIRRQITLHEPPHGLRYQVQWRSPRQVAYQANLYLRGYQGPVEQLRGSTLAPLELSWSAASATAHFFEQLVLGSEASLSVLVELGTKPGDLDATDERQLRLEVVRAGVLVWMGWVLPDLYEAPLRYPPFQATVRATDGLGTLKEVPLADGLGNALTGEYTHWQLLRFMFERLSLPLPWAVLHTLYPAQAVVTAQSEPLQLVSCDVAGFADSSGKPWTCEQVLQALLDYHEMRVQQREGTWYFERLAELSTDQLTPRRYEAAGQPRAATPYSLLRVVQPPYPDPTGLHYEQERQLLSRHPAVAAVSVTAEPGEARNYFPRADFPAAAFDPTSGQLLGWSGTLRVRREPNAQDARKAAGLRLLAGPNARLDSPLVYVPNAGGAAPFANTAIGVGNDFRSFRCALRLTIAPDKDSGFTADEAALQADFRLGLGYRLPDTGAMLWLTPDEYIVVGANPAAGFAPDAFPVYQVNGTGKVDVTFHFTLDVLPPSPAGLVLRLHGSGKGEAVLSNLTLTVGSATNGSYVQESSGDTKAGPRLTKRDTSLTLQLADTLNVDERVFAVLARSVLLAATGQPLSLWRQGLDATQPAYYLIDFIVRDRLGWQQKPAWVLRALLAAGDFSAGALLVDPDFDPATAFITTAARWLPGPDTWEITAVQGLGYVVPLPAPTYGLLTETGALLLSEDLAYSLVPEDAY